MKKGIKIIKKLTKKVGGSLPLLKNGIKRLVVLIETGKIGLITISRSKSLNDLSLLGLNFTVFIAGIAGTLKEIIPAPALVRVC
jgi:hypothetical protein